MLFPPLEVSLQRENKAQHYPQAVSEEENSILKCPKRPKLMLTASAS